MSVIENPAAYLNETNQVEYDEQTPVTKPVKKKPPVKPGTTLDETPLTSDKEKSMSPRQLNCTAETTYSAVSEDKLCSVSDLPDLSLSSQIGDKAETDLGKPGNSACDQSIENGKTAVDSESIKDKSSEQLESNPSKEPVNEKTSKPGAGSNNILALAKGLESDDSEDEEYVPGVDPEEENEEQEEEKEGEEIVSRQYSLRDGVKGTEKEEVKEVSHDDSEKKKADDLWSAFKADVAVPIKRKAKEFETTIKERTYDFAGEAVTVREEIKNKRRSLASTLGLDRKRRRESAPILSRAEEEEKCEGSSKSTSDTQDPTVTGTKRNRPVSKLNSLVNRLTKRPKMTVLNKTSHDWSKFKKDNDIEEDVKNEAKAEGYLEKQDFLSRADQKQFELEREIRAQQARRRQMMGSKQF